METTTVISLVSGAVGSGAVGFLVKAVWDSYFGYRDRVRMEVWRLRTSELEQRLSQFYWPLHMRLKHDDLVWQTVYRHLRPDNRNPVPEWVNKFSKEEQAALALKIEQDILMANHQKTAEIIRGNIHRANTDDEFENYLARYMRHVDTYASLRAAGITSANPRDVGEPFPNGLSAAVEKRLRQYQQEYENLLRDRGILDLSRGTGRGHRDLRQVAHAEGSA
jgi:hypothetical protein